MSNIYTARTDKANPIYAPMVNDSTFQDFTLEPQYVRVRANNTANLIFNSTDIVVTTSDPTNLILTQYGSPSAILMRKAKRIALTRIQFSHSTPCINKRNNNVTIFRADTNAIVTFDLPEANFTTPTDLMTFLVTIFNTIPGLAGINFGFNVSAGIDNVFQLYSIAGIRFSISPVCSAAAFGWWCYGFPYNYRADFVENVANLNALASEYMSIGPVNLTYSPFVDFNSTALNSYSKVCNSSTAFGQNRLVGRLPLRRWNGADPDALKNRTYDIQIENPVWFTWNPEENINAIDFQLTDDIGKSFYAPTFIEAPGSAVPFIPMEKNFYGISWTLTFNVEI